MLKYIDPFYFFISLFIGIFIMYISSPIPNVIIKYPTPENSSDLIFKDESGVCYKYEVEEMSCPEDSSKVKKILTDENKSKKDTGIIDVLLKRFTRF